MCTNGTRVLVQRALAEEFVSQCTAAAQALRVGDPTSELTQIGALITAEHTEKVLGCVQSQRTALSDAPHPHPRCVKVHGGGSR